MSIKPFLKWAGGKRWIVERDEFRIPKYSGRYIEPFLGGGAVYFHQTPKKAILSDINPRLVETYQAIRSDWKKVWKHLEAHQFYHSKDYYYTIRSQKKLRPHTRAAQFLYLNRACWNGLYRENLKGEFNVPIGTKSNIIMADDNFERISEILKNAEIMCCDFETTINMAKAEDFIFVDPPYTVAHNFNGFVKYNEKIFSWADQERLAKSLKKAQLRGASIILTNAAHPSVEDLYKDQCEPVTVSRSSIIAGNSQHRKSENEFLFYISGGFK